MLWTHIQHACWSGVHGPRVPLLWALHEVNHRAQIWLCGFGQVVTCLAWFCLRLSGWGVMGLVW